jgi:hypothetical protein
MPPPLVLRSVVVVPLVKFSTAVPKKALNPSTMQKLFWMYVEKTKRKVARNPGLNVTRLPHILGDNGKNGDTAAQNTHSNFLRIE